MGSRITQALADIMNHMDEWNTPMDRWPKSDAEKRALQPFNTFVNQIIDSVSNSFKWDSEKASREVLAALRRLEQEGLIPPLPPDDALPEDENEWVAQALGAHVPAKVMTVLQS